MSRRRVSTGDTDDLIVDATRGAPSTRGWEARLRRAASTNPDALAFVWDDVILSRAPGLRLDPYRMVWPDPHPLLLSQVSAAGRCAVRGSAFDRLHREGRLADDADTGAALRTLAEDARQRIVRVPDVLRLTWRQDSPVYAPQGRPTPSRRARRISVVVNYRDRPDLMARCIRGLARQMLTAELEVLLIDNRSTPRGATEVRAAARVLEACARVRHLTFAAEFNKSAQDNLGAREASGEVVVFLNNDAELLHADCLQTICDWALEPGILVAGPQMLGDHDRLVSNGVFIRPAGPSGPALIRENEWKPLRDSVRLSACISFCCAAVSKAALARVGPFDEAEFKSQYNDADLILRGLRLGLRCLHVGSVACRHEPGQSEHRTKAKTAALLERFRERHPDLGSFAGIDFDVVKSKAIPSFESRTAQAAMAAVRSWRRVRPRIASLRPRPANLLAGRSVAAPGAPES